MSKSTVSRYIKSYIEHGYVKYKKHTNNSSKDELVKKLIAQNLELKRQMRRQGGEGGNYEKLGQYSYLRSEHRKKN